MMIQINKIPAIYKLNPVQFVQLLALQRQKYNKYPLRADPQAYFDINMT